MQELDLRSIFYLLLARIKWIVAAVVIGAVLLGGYTALFVEDQYTSSAKLYVKNVSQDYNANAATSSNLTASERLAKTIRVAATTNTTLREVSTQLGGKMTAGELRSAVSFSQTEETSFLQIMVTHTDPDLAQDACRLMANASAKAFEKTGETGVATVYEDAQVAVKTGPNTMKTAIIGGLIGLVLAVAIVLLRTLFDNTVRDKDDLRMRLDIPVLGEIPSFDLAVKGGAKRG